MAPSKSFSPRFILNFLIGSGMAMVVPQSLIPVFSEQSSNTNPSKTQTAADTTLHLPTDIATAYLGPYPFGRPASSGFPTPKILRRGSPPDATPVSQMTLALEALLGDAVEALLGADPVPTTTKHTKPAPSHFTNTNQGVIGAAFSVPDITRAPSSWIQSSATATTSPDLGVSWDALTVSKTKPTVTIVEPQRRNEIESAWKSFETHVRNWFDILKDEWDDEIMKRDLSTKRIGLVEHRPRVEAACNIGGLVVDCGSAPLASSNAPPATFASATMTATLLTQTSSSGQPTSAASSPAKSSSAAPPVQTSSPGLYTPPMWTPTQNQNLNISGGVPPTQAPINEAMTRNSLYCYYGSDGGFAQDVFTAIEPACEKYLGRSMTELESNGFDLKTATIGDKVPVIIRIKPTGRVDTFKVTREQCRGILNSILINCGSNRAGSQSGGQLEMMSNTFQLGVGTAVVASA